MSEPWSVSPEQAKAELDELWSRTPEWTELFEHIANEHSRLLAMNQLTTAPLEIMQNTHQRIHDGERGHADWEIKCDHAWEQLEARLSEPPRDKPRLKRLLESP